MPISSRFLKIGIAIAALAIGISGHAAPDPAAVASVQAIHKKRVDGLTLLNEAYIQQYEAVKRKHVEAGDLEHAGKTEAKIAKMKKEIAELQASLKK